ncbi:hypothetical protein E4N62_19880 [Streptomyces sp. MNU76]|uniref:hypothetical protein n=1 Tax=Streptomyces sp. MNU76 TaxID=2560026 RepID=UPI001E54A7AF|nr:hypothetical protein [Streptomyces sp. MNU76]MCC9707341.1 hypothetical protein [Streptomyces sp. MNU76]
MTTRRAPKRKAPKTPPTWMSQYGEPQGKHRDDLLAASSWSSRLLQHDGGQDVVVLPLALGLAALDAVQVPIADGHSLIADYLHGKLLAVVASGWAQLWEFVPDVRVVPYGGWVVVPAPGRAGSYAAAWLSLPPPQLTQGDDEGEDETTAGLRPDSLRALVSAGALDPRQLYEGLVGRPATCEAVAS